LHFGLNYGIVRTYVFIITVKNTKWLDEILFLFFEDCLKVFVEKSSRIDGTFFYENNMESLESFGVSRLFLPENPKIKFNAQIKRSDNISREPMMKRGSPLSLIQLNRPSRFWDQEEKI